MRYQIFSMFVAKPIQLIVQWTPTNFVVFCLFNWNTQSLWKFSRCLFISTTGISGGRQFSISFFCAFYLITGCLQSYKILQYPTISMRSYNILHNPTLFLYFKYISYIILQFLLLLFLLKIFQSGALWHLKLEIFHQSWWNWSQKIIKILPSREFARSRIQNFLQPWWTMGNGNRPNSFSLDSYAMCKTTPPFYNFRVLHFPTINYNFT